MSIAARNDVARHAREGYQPGWALPSYHYQSPDCYANDVAGMLDKVWWLGGHMSEFTKAGDYKTFQVASESILLVRGKDGTVNAFHNICRHRAMRLCTKDKGNAPLLTCGYHAWTYKLDGSLLPPSNMPKDFDRSQFGLLKAHIEVLDGLIFVNLAQGEAPDFEDFASRLRPFMKPYAIDRTRLVVTKQYPTDSNWKVSVENFAECYHCLPAHGDMLRVFGADATPDAELSPGGESWTQRMERLGRLMEPVYDSGSNFHMQQALQISLKPGSLTFTRTGQPCAPLLGDMTEFTNGWTLISFNPFIHAFLFDDFVHFLSYVPTDTGKTMGTLYWLVRDDAKDEDVDLHALVDLSNQVMNEDVFITDEVQRGVQSTAYRPGRLGSTEDRVEAFHDWYFRYLAPETEPAEPVPAE